MTGRIALSYRRGMGENEKAVREALGWMKSRAGFGGTPAELKRAADAISGLDALLAEHRSEADDLRQEVERLSATLRGALAGELVVYADGEVEAKVSAARDAALEEAVQYHDRKGDEAQKWLEVHRRSAVALRALKSNTAERYLRESEVREMLRGCGWDASEAAKRLGVDLDAKGERPRPSEKRHWLNDVQECSDRCPACAENTARGFNPDGTDPEP